MNGGFPKQAPEMKIMIDESKPMAGILPGSLGLGMGRGGVRRVVPLQRLSPLDEAMENSGLFYARYNLFWNSKRWKLKSIKLIEQVEVFFSVR